MLSLGVGRGVRRRDGDRGRVERYGNGSVGAIFDRGGCGASVCEICKDVWEGDTTEPRSIILSPVIPTGGRLATEAVAVVVDCVEPVDLGRRHPLGWQGPALAVSVPGAKLGWNRPFFKGLVVGTVSFLVVLFGGQARSAVKAEVGATDTHKSITLKPPLIGEIATGWAGGEGEGEIVEAGGRVVNRVRGELHELDGLVRDGLGADGARGLGARARDVVGHLVVAEAGGTNCVLAVGLAREVVRERRPAGGARVRLRSHENIVIRKFAAAHVLVDEGRLH